MSLARLDQASARRLEELLLSAASTAAAACWPWRGKGDKIAADQAAVTAIRTALLESGMGFLVVSGEGLLDEAPRLDQGERIGTGLTETWDVAVDPLDGTALCADGKPGAVCAIGIGDEGTLLAAPDGYMWKAMVGPGIAAEIIHPDNPVGDMLREISRVRGKAVHDLTVSLLDRPRHAGLMEDIKRAGASVRLLEQGDLLPAQWVCQSETSGVDLHIGTGGAPEGVLSAIILKALGGQMTARLMPQDDSEARQLAQSGIAGCDIQALTLDQIVGGNAVLALASVTGTLNLPAPRPVEGLLEVAAEAFSTLNGAGTRGMQLALEQYPADKD